MTSPRGARVALSIVEGRSLRDLFYNGLLDQLTSAGARVTVYTEAIRVEPFVREWTRAGVEFRELHVTEGSAWRSRAFHFRRRLARRFGPGTIDAFHRWEARRLYPPRDEYLDQFRADPPDVLLATHVHLPIEAELLSAARACAVPTVGLVRSWDNVHKGLYCRPDQIAVWNEVNATEVVELEGYRRAQVHVVGAPQFDPYFTPEATCTREAFARRHGLDPTRPVIMFATVGYFIPGYDETGWLDVLLNAIDAGEIDPRTQVLCRLHPWSRLEHFQRYEAHPAVRLSWVQRYWPALQWYMTREDVLEFAQMLRHADVVITPGSTVTLEAAIFDRPTVVPVFHAYQPERAAAYYRAWVFGKHYGRLEQLDLVPIVREQQSFAAVVNRCLAEPGWYRRQRADLVRDYVQFVDGRSTERVSRLALDIAGASNVTAAIGTQMHATEPARI